MTTTETTDVILIGGGIMSATLGMLIKELEPSWQITMVERLDQVAQESSNPWNNAGTGHSALCELNYAPLGADGTVNPDRAIGISEQFQTSRQFWATLLAEGKLADNSFINTVPHMSLVFGDDHCNYLKKRFDAFKPQKLFESMEFSEDAAQISDWAPLTIEGRSVGQRIAATYCAEGTDIDFGNLATQMIKHLADNGMDIHYNQHVEDIRRDNDGSWCIRTSHTKNGKNSNDGMLLKARFVFLGAGGGALPLLQKTGIPEGKGYGGFPVSGLFFRNNSEATAMRHNAKVYGQAAVGAPPMSVPHLDTRHVNGKRHLMFGPFAGFSPNFLKQGSKMDLVQSMKRDNILPMMRASLDNIALTKYLFSELSKKREERLVSLHEYYPLAKDDEWELITAGQRVQVIKKCEQKGGVLQFGTELVASADGSIACLLGASPGASTAAPLMIKLLHQCFPERTRVWRCRLRELVPCYGIKLNENHGLANEMMKFTSEALGIYHH